MFCTMLSGCSFITGMSTKTVYGKVLYQGEGLAGVKITDRVNVYAETDADGNFSFETTNKNLVLYPQKQGFMFLPSYSQVLFNTSNVFTALDAQLLNGKLVLEKVMIMPTSIVSYIDKDFSCKKQDVTGLKIYDLSISVNDSDAIICTFDDVAAIKEETDIFCSDQNFVYDIVDGVAQIKLAYSLSAYFKSNYRESIAIEGERVLRINKTLDTGNLVLGYYELYASGINSTHNGYSYNISFMFKYLPL